MRMRVLFEIFYERNCPSGRSRTRAPDRPILRFLITWEKCAAFVITSDGIGGTDADLWDLDDFTNHPSVQLIEQKSRGCEKFDFQEVNPTQVKRVLESLLDVNKATGHDGISTKILRAGAEEISLSLSTLFNSCIKKGLWPCDWKKADWTLVYKKTEQ